MKRKKTRETGISSPNRAVKRCTIFTSETVLTINYKPELLSNYMQPHLTQQFAPHLGPKEQGEPDQRDEILLTLLYKGKDLCRR